VVIGIVMIELHRLMIIYHHIWLILICSVLFEKVSWPFDLILRQA